jgi:hypothetical protein
VDNDHLQALRTPRSLRGRVPDYRVRLDAVEKLLQQGLGRAREAQEAPASEVPAVASDVMKLPWKDLQRFAATLCLDDLVALQRRGAEALLRERVAALSDSERRVLQEALDVQAV